jgi:hypothetical protein
LSILNLKQQVELAITMVDAVFYDGSKPPIPEGATVQGLWDEILKMRGLIKKPKVVETVRMLLEDERLADVPIPVLADVMKKVFARHRMKCATTENSIRWYISQHTMSWDIKRRAKNLPILTAAEAISAAKEASQEEPASD